MKAALLQLNSSDDPAQNLADTVALIDRAAAQGAEFVATPEVTNCISMDRDHQQRVLQHEADDQTLIGLRAAAKAHSIWLSVGSLALKTGDPDGRFVNRSFVIDPFGDVVARYDKIHMFDVAVSETETYKESAGYRPGTRAVIAQTPFGVLGLSICFDLRFPYLYRALAQSGAEILLVPAAFSPVTGAAHWETLLRARAIETGSYVLAAAQTGAHASSTGRMRQTYGHSLAISPWGEVLADSGTSPGITMVDIDRTKVAQSRKRIAALASDRAFEGP
ncbi:carbon-nitrogen hydrolase family protein [Yoonia sp. I 8.24]|uniref:carbon-nitrogen hydrolase family protein n=1 Tax=Yoonia sp. I 8.24 TaxID=1537229 RepID=UPI001EE05E9A|nr:carbon-nitrogen hydrolase family protein [Yoonia sp. I 8.24]MCG3268466.1 carbon-nitrogen hydrolase family protein [Yoonia sp. I 8.24]